MLKTSKVQVLVLFFMVGFFLYWFQYRQTEIRETKPRVLILTPFKQSAHLIDQYFENLEKLEYPSHLVSLGFIVSDSTDGTLDKIRAKRKGRWDSVRVIEKNFNYKLEAQEGRHAFEVQVQRRGVMAKSRNTLLLSTLEERHDYVLWLDGDVVTYPKTLLTDLMNVDKDVVAPNCWWKSYNEEGGYDKNNWQETEASLKLQEGMKEEQVLVEGYDTELKTHRKLMVDMRDEGISDIFRTVRLDAVGGTCTFVKANVHREGAIFPPFPFHHQVETEGFAKMALALGYSVWGLPNYIVYHYI